MFSKLAKGLAKMTALDSIIERHFPAYMDLPMDAKTELHETLLLYLFRGLNSSTLTSTFRDVLEEPVSLTLFRNALVSDGYILKNIKGFLLHAVSAGHTRNYRLAARSARKYGVQDTDVVLAKYVHRSTRLQATLNKYTQTYPILSLPDIDTTLTDVAQDLQKWASIFTRRKLTFICQSNSLDREDMVAELTARALQAVLVTYPCFESTMHATNVAKRAMHNHGINLIMHYTSKGRGILFANGDGTFSSKRVSYDALAATHFSQQSNDSEPTYEGLELVTHDTQLDTRVAVRSMLEKTPGKKRRFLLYLMGEYCEAFTSWLQEHQITSSPNDEYYDRLAQAGNTQRYIDLALAFLGVRSDVGLRYVTRLRSQLG